MKKKKKKQQGKTDDQSGKKKIKTKIKKKAGQPKKNVFKIYTSADKSCKQWFLAK